MMRAQANVSLTRDVVARLSNVTSEGISTMMRIKLEDGSIVPMRDNYVQQLLKLCDISVAFKNEICNPGVSMVTSVHGMDMHMHMHCSCTDPLDLHAARGLFLPPGFWSDELYRQQRELCRQ